LLVLLIVGGTSLGGWYFYTHRIAAHPNVLTHKIKREMMKITIVDRGSVESAENNEITCKVKAKSQGGAASTIRWIIDNGSFVKKGDTLVELDDSALQDQLLTQQIDLANAEGAWLQAEEQYKIDVSDAEGAIKTAEVNLAVKKIQLEEYIKGLFTQSQVDLENQLTMARSDVVMWEERSAWSERMSRPGRQYVTVAQAEADRARLLSCKLTLKKIETQYQVLNDLTKEKTVTDYRGQVEEAVRQVERGKLQYEAKRLKADTDRKAKYLVYDKALSKARDTEKEIEHCLIKAPKDGMIVYYLEERSRFGGGKQRFIAQGEPVDENQKLMTIPNLKRMVVNAKVHEAMRPRVKADVKKPTGFSTLVEFGTYQQPNLWTAVTTAATFNDKEVRTPFLNDYRKAEQELVSDGQKAWVRFAAFPGQRLKGHVKSVAEVASQNDIFASDVKVYQTYVSIDDYLDGLKPGMDAEVTIEVDSQPEPVLALPLQALLGSVDMGAKRKCFVITEDGPQMRDITLGMSNETMVEVKEGLEEGDEVVLNPGVLLTERQRMEYGIQAPRSGQDEKAGPGGRGGRGGQGKGKGGGPGGPGGPGGMPGNGMQGGMPGGGMPGGGMPGGGAPGGGMPGGGMRGKGNWQGKGGGAPAGGAGGDMPAGGSGG
jgi:multidrug efflux pump subunit AcrA (membrane-fusion protein)